MGVRLHLKKLQKKDPKFITRRDRAQAVIILSIDPSILYLIGDPTEPTVVWNQLSAIFQKKTSANKLALC